MDDPPFFMRFLTPRSAPFLRAEIQHRIDGRQRDQTGEAKILVIHAGIAQAPQVARSAPAAKRTVKERSEEQEIGRGAAMRRSPSSHTVATAADACCSAKKPTSAKKKPPPEAGAWDLLIKP